MRTSKPKITTRRNPGGSISYCVDSGTFDAGRRHRKFFSSRREAKTYARKMQAARKTQGALAFSLDTRSHIDAAEANELLKPYGVSLVKAAGYYIKHAQPKGGQILFSKAATEFLGIKTKAGKKPRYVKALRSKLDKFNLRFGDRYVHEINTLEIEEWLPDFRSNKRPCGAYWQT